VSPRAVRTLPEGALEAGRAGRIGRVELDDEAEGPGDGAVRRIVARDPQEAPARYRWC
jgi:hypothetical protein